MPFVDEMPTRRLAVPGEEGEWFEIRLLSWKELDECRREQSRKFLGRVREMGPDLLKAVGEIERPVSSDAAGADDAERQAARDAIAQAREENRRVEELESFDRETLVTKSVVGWSYERHFQQTLLGKLDEATFNWLFEAISAMYVGDDAQRKAASGSCSTISTKAETESVPTPST